MADGPASFNRDFSCPGLLRNKTQTVNRPSPTGLSPSMAALSNALRLDQNPPPEGPAGPSGSALLPRADNGCSLSRPRSLGSSPSARRYSGNHNCFLFLRVLRCFSSPGSPRVTYVFSYTMTGHHPGRVPPFGYPRINARLQLPVAFRSLPRPSSPSCAQASTTRPLRLIPPA